MPRPANRSRSTARPVPRASETGRRTLLGSRLWPALLLVLIVAAVYTGSLRGAFVLDDDSVIQNNPNIRHLWPLTHLLAFQGGQTVSGRPLLNLSLAINFAMGGLDPLGYHLVNLVIHLASALLLMGLVRRCLESPVFSKRPIGPPRQLAFWVALLWAVHPLTTAAVTYIVQRAESLMALLYLATLYCMIRGASSARPRRWYAAAVVTCWLGMTAKEVMVTAPLAALLIDRTLLAGSFKQALIRRRWLYLGLFGSWSLLAVLVIGSGSRGDTAGFGGAIPWWEYAQTQLRAIVLYFKLSIWPAPLVFDYGTLLTRGWVATGYGLILLGMISLCIWGLWRRRAAALAGSLFFLVLLPSSSIVPVITQTMAEHRVYLPLAAIIVLAVGGIWRLPGAAAQRPQPWLMRIVLGGSAIILAVLTVQRNVLYADPVALWRDTVAKLPANDRAHLQLYLALIGRGRLEEAYRAGLEGLAHHPTAQNQNNVGAVLLQLNRPHEAAAYFRKAVELAPTVAPYRGNLGEALDQSGDGAQALQQLHIAVEQDPASNFVRLKLAQVYINMGMDAQAQQAYAQCVARDPASADAHFGLGNVLVRSGQISRGREEYLRCLEINPQFAPALENLGVLEFREGNILRAMQHWRAGLAAAPDSPSLLVRLARVLATSPDPALRSGREALMLAARAVELSGGGDPEALAVLAAAQAECGAFVQSAATCEKAINLANQSGRAPLAGALSEQLQLYRKNQPLRHPAGAPSQPNPSR